jgi:hypothetical protein
MTARTNKGRNNSKGNSNSKGNRTATADAYGDDKQKGKQKRSRRKSEDKRGKEEWDKKRWTKKGDFRDARSFGEGLRCCPRTEGIRRIFADEMNLRTGKSKDKNEIQGSFAALRMTA